MGLFDKKYCDICGEKIGLLGNRKLEDGNLCKDCAAKLSPWFSDRRHTTIEDIRAQLNYREENRPKADAFRTSRIYGEDTWRLMLDEQNGTFAVCRKDGMPDSNPDIIPCSDITACRPDTEEHKTEIRYRDSEGKEQSYSPRRYEYSYEFYYVINVNHPYIEEIRFKLNPMRVTLRQSTGAEKVSGVLGVLAGQSQYVPMMNPEYDKYINMGNEISNVLMASRTDAATRRHAEDIMEQAKMVSMAAQMAGMQSAQTAAMQSAWTCPYCGTQNSGKFCTGCGSAKD